MIRNFLLACFSLFIICPSAFAGESDELSLSDPRHLDWFKEARFGMFIHWGLYSMLEGSYNGHTLPDAELPQGKSWYAEWIQTRFEVPAPEYRNLARKFNPEKFNADTWIREARDAGMKYFVITSKHHDGFALWDSRVSEFTVMNTPFKRDVLAELVAACKKYDLKYGFYYSHWQDWEHPHGAWPVWVNPGETKDFDKYWKEKCLPQVRELLVNFDPDLLWFDTWGDEKHDITPERRDELIALVRANSRKCLINGRIRFIGPGDHIDFLEMHDNTYPEKILDKPWQTPATMVHSWGWHARDFNWKPSSRMIGYLASNASKGGNYLLNVGPKPDGTFPAPAVRRLREMGGWMQANGESVYGTLTTAIQAKPQGICLTSKKEGERNYLYAFITSKAEQIILSVPCATVKKSEILETGQPIPFSGTETSTHFEVPSTVYTDDAVYVLKVTLK